jgi:hypothetical protein
MYGCLALVLPIYTWMITTRSDHCPHFPLLALAEPKCREAARQQEMFVRLHLLHPELVDEPPWSLAAVLMVSVPECFLVFLHVLAVPSG